MDEVCDNGIDDDGDGLIDLNDDECECVIVEPESLIPNPSFEDLNCCPNGRSQLNCAEVWIQASAPTTDLINTCDWLGWEEFPPPMPFPDGESIMGFRDGRVRGFSNGESTPERNWKEYAGACLLSPLVAGTSYRFEFDLGFVDRTKSPSINVSFFGTSDCEYLPFGGGDDEFGCPTNGPNWVRLGSTFVSGGTNLWVKSFIEITPSQNISAIAIGPDCPAVNTPVNVYYFFDNLLLADFESFALNITSKEHPCSQAFTLGIQDGFVADYQWYKDGIALVGETKTELNKMYGNGKYQIRIKDGESCRVSKTFDYEVPIIRALETSTICLDDTYAFGEKILTESGTYIDTFKSVNNCDSIVTLDLKELGFIADTINGKIFEGETFDIQNYRFSEKGENLATLQSSTGCDSLVLLHLDYYDIFFPNIFSPNGDGVNDTFKVFGSSEEIQNSKLNIYDQWGNRLYSGQEWDGKFKNRSVNNGIYSYVNYLTMDDGKERKFSGTLTVFN